MNTKPAAAGPRVGGTTAAAPLGALPMFFDLRKVPVSAWAEYAYGTGAAARTVRIAVVARDSQWVTIEVSMQVETTAGVRTLTIRAVVDPMPAPGSGPTIKELVLRVGDDDPVAVPLASLPQNLRAHRPAHLVGRNRIAVPAGTFKARHYREYVPGYIADVWMSDAAGPFGLVRVDSIPRSSKGASETGAIESPQRIELKATGMGAQATITKPARPGVDFSGEAESTCGAGSPRGQLIGVPIPDSEGADPTDAGAMDGGNSYPGTSGDG